MRVQIAFSLYKNGIGDYFTLDDSTKGVLDGATYTLAGDVLVDVTDTVRAVQIRRGRNLQLGRFTAGGANIRLSNASRKYDPLYGPTIGGTRTNLLTNPSFEVNTTGWSGFGATLTRDTSSSVFGAACLRATYTGTGNGPFSARIGVTEGTTYTASAYINSGDTGKGIRVGIAWYTALAGGSQVGSSAYGNSISGAAWGRSSVSATCPAGAVAAQILVYAASAPAASTYSLTDAVMFEQSSTLLAYFDGTYADPSISVNSLTWNGTANASTSTLVWNSDPGSPYYGSIVPGKEVIIDHAGYVLYTGNVADWNLDYDLGGDNTAQASCSDGLAAIAGQLVSAGTATAQLTGARVNAYLTDVGWPTTQRAISAGQATLGADVIGANTNAITYLQSAVDSDPGALFVSKTGLMTFRDRNDLQAFTSGATFGPAAIPFTDIQVEYGIETLYPTVLVNYWGGTAVAQVSASDATAVTAYGNSELTVDTLLGSVTDATALANYLVSRYGNPVYRVKTLTVALHGLDSSQVSQVLALELGDMILVDGWAPGGVGAPISQYLTIEGIEHDADPGQHLVTFTLSETYASFLLDSAQWGVLDTNRIGF